jgi:ribosomal protein S13
MILTSIFMLKMVIYKGLCLQMGLPVKGQRTHSNASIAGSLNRNRISSMLLMGGLRKTDDQRKKKKFGQKNKKK